MLRDFPLPWNAQIGCGADPSCILWWVLGFFPMGKVACAWSWPLTSNRCRAEDCGELNVRSSLYLHDGREWLSLSSTWTPAHDILVYKFLFSNYFNLSSLLGSIKLIMCLYLSYPDNCWTSWCISRNLMQTSSFFHIVHSADMAAVQPLWPEWH